MLRCKQRMELEVVLDVSKFLVSQYDGFDAVPLYVVVGGCVFCEYHALACLIAWGLSE